MSAERGMLSLEESEELMLEFLSETQKHKAENTKLKQQLADADALIEFCLIETAMHSCDKDKLREYKSKYKVGEK